MKKALSEKNDYFNILRNIDNLYQEQSLKIAQLVKEIKTLSEGSVKPVKKFECRNCDFITNSEIGLKQHNTKKNKNKKQKKTEDQRKKIGCARCKFNANSSEP